MKPIKTVSLLIKLDELKGSVNNLLIPSKHGRRLVYSGNYRSAKNKVQEYLTLNYLHLKNYLADHPLYYYTTVHYVAYDRWLTKSSKYLKLKKKDVANYTKNAEDVVFSFLGADDSSIIKSIIEKGIIEEGQSVALQCDIEMYAMESLSMIRFNDVRNNLNKTIS